MYMYGYLRVLWEVLMLYRSTWWILEQRLLPNALSLKRQEKRTHTGEHEAYKYISSSVQFTSTFLLVPILSIYAARMAINFKDRATSIQIRIERRLYYY